MIAGSNHAMGMECCVLFGRGLCDGPIPFPVYSYQVLCVLSVICYKSNPLWLDRGQTIKSIQLQLLQAGLFLDGRNV